MNRVIINYVGIDMQEFRKALIVKISIAAGIILVLAIILAVFLAILNSRVNAISELREKIFSRASGIEVLGLLRSQAEQAASYGNKLNKALPDRSEAFEFTRNISDIASSRKVEAVVNIGGETPGTESEPGRIGFSMNAKGQIGDILSFIEDLNKSGYIVNLSSFELIGSSATELRTSGLLFIK